MTQLTVSSTSSLHLFPTTRSQLIISHQVPTSCVPCRGTGYILVPIEEDESFTDLSGTLFFTVL